MADRSSFSRPDLRRWRRLAFAWGLFLFALTSWPSPPTVPVVSDIPNFDKLVHFCLYGMEAFLLYHAIAWPGRSRFSLLRALAVVGVMAVWAVADETHQAWIPGRSMESGDVAGDLVGASVGALAASATARRFRRSAVSGGATPAIS